MLWEGTVIPSQRFKDEERRERIVEFLTKNHAMYDIVGICECWSMSSKEQIVFEMKSFYPYFVYIETPYYEIGDGLLLLSKYNISDYTFVKFRRLVGVDTFSQKGVLSAILSVPGKEIRVFFSHSMFAFFLSLIIAQSGEEHTDARFDNLKQVKDLMLSYKPGIPAILFGDLNIAFSKDNKTEYTMLMDLFGDLMVDTFYPNVFVPTVDPTNNTIAHMFDTNEPEKDDYILIEKNLWDVKDYGVIYEIKLDDEDKNDCSDHFPIQAAFE